MKSLEGRFNIDMVRDQKGAHKKLHNYYCEKHQSLGLHVFFSSSPRGAVQQLSRKGGTESANFCCPPPEIKAIASDFNKTQPDFLLS